MNPDFNKSNGLIPVIVQDDRSLQVLMLGYMNAEALQRTKESGKVTFYSRSKRRLWTKGEGSGNFLIVKSIREDCDRDSLLILADPVGPTCHNGSASCFDAGAATGFYMEARGQEQNCAGKVPVDNRIEHAGLKEETGPSDKKTTESFGPARNAGSFLYQLERIIHERIRAREGRSYTYRLFQKGINKIAQKVGEEAVELVIEAKDNDAVLFKNEAADLLYHYLILLKAKGFSLYDIEAVLEGRHKR